MKALLIGLVVLSTSAFANNPELDLIFKKYESTLLNHKVGMTAIGAQESTEFEFDENGTLSTKLVKSTLMTTVLKVEGAKTYEYEVKKNNLTGEEEILVSLNDHADISGDNITDIKVVNDVLFAKFEMNSTDEYSVYNVKGDVSKDLLSSMFCGSSMNLVGTYTDLSSGSIFPVKTNIVTKCGSMISVDAVKKIDLSNVSFCDYTLPEDSQNDCEMKDMSFLTRDL
ncbi:MAG: hypothetical protein K2P81_05560 [Bacteriovoracaceae bacterium]|nr:hypothetical protein [Bacteriovoracaceae bacterium]